MQALLAICWKYSLGYIIPHTNATKIGNLAPLNIN